MASKPEVTVAETKIETKDNVSTETTAATVATDATTSVTLSEPDVICFGGKWLAVIDGVPVSFDSETEAKTALGLNKNKAVIEAEADEYCAARGYTGKNLVGKKNQIVDFLAWKSTK